MQLPEFKRDIVSIIANRLQEKGILCRLLLVQDRWAKLQLLIKL